MKKIMIAMILILSLIFFSACASKQVVKKEYIYSQCPKLNTLSNIKSCNKRVVLLERQILQYNQIFTSKRKLNEK